MTPLQRVGRWLRPHPQCTIRFSACVNQHDHSRPSLHTNIPAWAARYPCLLAFLACWPELRPEFSHSDMCNVCHTKQQENAVNNTARAMRDTTPVRWRQGTQGTFFVSGAGGAAQPVQHWTHPAVPPPKALARAPTSCRWSASPHRTTAQAAGCCRPGCPLAGRSAAADPHAC